MQSVFDSCQALQDESDYDAVSSKLPTGDQERCSDVAMGGADGVTRRTHWPGGCHAGLATTLRHRARRPAATTSEARGKEARSGRAWAITNCHHLRPALSNNAESQVVAVVAITLN